MANEPDDPRKTRYEYRVWGHREEVLRQLADLADKASTSTVADCYFLVDDLTVNAKVRSDSLKIKELVGHEHGFERWAATRHRTPDTAPPPFDGLVEHIGFHEADYDRAELAERLAELDPDHPARPVHVTKERTRFRIGKLRAEATDITLDDTGEVLHTICIEGSDLDALIALRSRLGLHGDDNIAVHRAIEDAL